MAVKAGQIIHVGNGAVLIDRIQTAGPGQLNIPTEKIYELGNYKSVATIRDVPDLQFQLESFDTSSEIERFLTATSAIDPVDGLDLALCVPVDIASQLKAGLLETDPTLVTSSVAVPYLYPESISYRFGLRDNASQQVSLRGDSIFYNPGATFIEETVGSNTANQAVVTAHAAYAAAVDDDRRVLAVTVGTERLTFGVDYEETVGTVTAGAGIATVTVFKAVPATKKIRVVYSSPSTVQYAQTVHPDTTVKPAAVKGRDISVYLGGYDPADPDSSLPNKVKSVQSVNVDWRVTLDRDEEFGNRFAVAQDFDVPAVTGSIDIKPRSTQELLDTIRQITGVTDPLLAVGPDTAVPIPLDIVIGHPDNDTIVKRLHVPDARFTVPGFSGQVQQKLTVSMPLESDGGTLLVFDE